MKPRESYLLAFPYISMATAPLAQDPLEACALESVIFVQGSAEQICAYHLSFKSHVNYYWRSRKFMAWQCWFADDIISAKPFTM